MFDGYSCAQSIAQRYLNKEVEIFMDQVIGRQSYSDYEVEDKSIIAGVVRGAIGDVLILDVVHSTVAESKTCEVLINGWMIKAVSLKSCGVALLDLIDLKNQRQYKRHR